MWQTSGYKWEIQVRNQETGLWEESATVVQRFEIETLPRKFLWWKWNELRVHKNEKWKETQASAVSVARRDMIEEKEVRVVRFKEDVYTGDDPPYVKQFDRSYGKGKTIWKNGRWID